MDVEIEIKPVHLENYLSYVTIGKKAYEQHYLHLWKNRNGEQYVQLSFTKEAVEKQLKNSNTILFMLYATAVPVGVLKLNKDEACLSFSKEQALLVDKIYILNEYSGMGIGKKALHFAIDYAKKRHKKVIWLEAMQEGPAIGFYLKNGFKKEDTIILPFSNLKENQRKMYRMLKELP